MTLGLFLSFWGEMDALHTAVFNGWLNAAAIAHEHVHMHMGALNFIWFFSTRSFLWYLSIKTIILFYNTYIWIAQSLFILCTSSGDGQPCTLSFHHWNHLCCMTHTCNSVLLLNPTKSILRLISDRRNWDVCLQHRFNAIEEILHVQSHLPRFSLKRKAFGLFPTEISPHLSHLKCLYLNLHHQGN